MNKIDLIIDCLEGWKELNPEFWYDNDELALSYARELRALKPIAWIHVYESGTGYQSKSLSLSDKSKIPTIHKPIPLFALGDTDE